MRRDDECNIEAWVEVMSDILLLVDPKDRVKILEAAVADEREKIKIRDENPFGVCTISDLAEGFESSPSVRYYGKIERLKSNIIYVLMRQITNNHSENEAADLLFAQQIGPGSGWLADYLVGLPGLKVDLQDTRRTNSTQPHQ